MYQNNPSEGNDLNFRTTLDLERLIFEINQIHTSIQTLNTRLNNLEKYFRLNEHP